jgi:hypothetical protein
MPRCPDRERLTTQYHDAVVIFSASVTHLKGCNGDGNGFAEAQRETDVARLHAENARVMLEMHRAEHGC